MVVMAGLAALAVVMGPWVLVRAAVTIAHEGGHALTASAVGGAVDHIRIHRAGGGGHTDSWLEKDPFKRFLVSLAGYLGPPVFGVAGAMLLSTGRVRPTLWVSLVLVACALVLARGWYTVVSMVATGGLILLVLRHAGDSTQTFFAYMWVWYLLIAGIRTVRELARDHALGPLQTSDASQLRDLTRLPARLWVAFFGLTSWAALVAGGLIMVGAIGPAAP